MPAKKQLKPAEKPVAEMSNEEKAKALKSLLKRTETVNAAKDDRAALAAMLRDKPDAWREIADMMHQAKANVIDRANATGTAKEFMSLGCEQLRDELAQPGDGRLEKILIDAVVLAWLRLTFVEQSYSQIWASQDGVTFERGIFWEKRLNAAHNRFEAACVNLAKVRKLLRPRQPQTNLNIGQINTLLASGHDSTLGNLGLVRQAS